MRWWSLIANDSLVLVTHTHNRNDNEEIHTRDNWLRESITLIWRQNRNKKKSEGWIYIIFISGNCYIKEYTYNNHKDGNNIMQTSDIGMYTRSYADGITNEKKR